ncbi:trehalase family glycosidase [Paraburkholderia humisilvae]|uniref:trehalase family glycosidase n=1 Tax=Paraburkholderia humisilvae TaxID=627669 RepID=UPI0015824315
MGNSIVEKYNVESHGARLPAGGGEYALQEGFGWTNGVLLVLLAMYPGSNMANSGLPKSDEIPGSTLTHSSGSKVREREGEIGIESLL